MSSFFKPLGKKHREEATESLFKNLNWSQHFLEHDEDFFSPSKPFELGITATITAMAYDPLQSLLAVGTADGCFHLWGRPGVSTSWQNRPAHSIKFLAFKSGSPLICAIDSKNYLTVYNLSKVQDEGPLREFTHSVRSTVTCFDISPAHSHMFLGLEDGTVDCFDLDRGIISPYRIRNLWFEQEALYRKSGAPGAPSARHIPMCTDIKIHPYDINLILIAHEGGISLYNVKQEHVVRTFQLIIPPGAIGGSSDPNDPSIFEDRRPKVNCLCFRPDGLMIAAGYSDGCIAFWSINDGEIPVTVRTIDRENVFTFDWEEPADTPVSQTIPSPKFSKREPIFRLAWSNSSAGPSNDSNKPDKNDLAKDGSKLVILGGLLVNDPRGVHVLHFPKYHLNVKPTSEIDSDTRSALKGSVASVGRTVYLTEDIPDDFLLIPRKSPYFDGAEDPVAILISSTWSRKHDWLNSGHFTINDDHSHSSGRTVHGYSFPPNISKEPREFLLPASFDWIGSKSILTSQLFDLSEVAYQFLRSSNTDTSTQLQPDPPNPLPLRGGHAKASPLIAAALQDDHQQASMVLDEFSNKHRMLVTIHMDYKIRFWDFSPALLLPRARNSSDPDNPQLQDKTTQHDSDLKADFPRRLEHLTVDMTALFRPTSTGQSNPKLAMPIEVQFNQESLDLLIILASRDSLLYTFHHQTFVSKEVSYPLELNTPLSASPSSRSMNPASSADSNHGKLAEAPDRAIEQPLQILQLAGQPSESGEQSLGPISLNVPEVSCVTSNGFLPTALIKIIDSKAAENTCTSARTEGPGGVLYALTDIGFLAIAHPREEWIKVIDLRKSRLLFSDVVRHESKSRGKSKSKENPICCMYWTIARTESDSATLPRLLVGYANGLVNMINLTPSDMASIDNWTAASNTNDSFRCDLSHHHKSGTSNHPISIFIFDSNGNPLLANLTSLRNALSQETRSKAVFEDDPVPSPRVSLDSISIIVFSHSVIVRTNINGPQLVCRSDLSSEPIIQASMLSYQGSYALLLIDQKRSCHILSLPKLEVICRTCLPMPNGIEHMGQLSIDCCADVVEQSSLSTTQLSTLFFGRDLIYLPELELYNPDILPPDPPQPYSSLLTTMTTNLTLNIASWFNQGSHSSDTSGGGSGNSRVTGAELDSIIAGPLRPEGRKIVPQPHRINQQTRSRSFTLTKPNRLRSQASKDPSFAKDQASVNSKRSPSNSTSMSNSNSLGAKTQLNRNIDALDERSDRLKFLNERFDDMTEASNDMLNQAKRIAQQQAAKSTFSTGLSSVKSLFK
ncbi:hypothetical protein MJO28_000486 [Puccinia striiformis f. sp. tritici]|uniref:Uncharacterized protein n=3 Tax=Puccinia striiformis f. sp. tritici TaxID=168172 RepID=A0A0L0URL8_9BASI|nr:hypothetical protein Pst134EB_001971 [Puccinia striiformis f. sp. tritici]KAI7962392.1 hypothetical protein MJO28_000486 [Puccinia striiformis f. sp. tritici]KAI7967469.1 hypothetical protein MJO29_000746 [Puccinia striiformis f. sp. tritici]KNE89732.1 hypothetical protein PSTG_16803 [Puccinia striiformis f. sp. tritici PST-78]